jgi:hypothetical protein
MAKLILDLKYFGSLLTSLIQRGQSEIETGDNDSNYHILNSAIFFDACNACTDALKTARCALEPSGTSFNFPREVSESVVTSYSLPNQTPVSHTASTEIIRLLR